MGDEREMAEFVSFAASFLGNQSYYAKSVV